MLGPDPASVASTVNPSSLCPSLSVERCAMNNNSEQAAPARSVVPLSKPRLRRTEASAYLLEAHGVPVKASTLAKMATMGGGPIFQKSGPTPLYMVVELDRWATTRLGRPRTSTSDQR